MSRIFKPFLWLTLLLNACTQKPEVQQIVDKSIAAHGGETLQQSKISFDFRKKHLEVVLDNGRYRYQSTVEDSIGLIHDEMDNESFIRKVDNEMLPLDEEKALAYRNTLNSIVYFALLPYFLNDPAANKELLGTTTIKGKPYYEVKVSFKQEGGGTDYEDEYIYWIHQQDYTMDYLAYSFHVNEGGTRFREAYNVRNVKGIRFADYINYEATVENFELQDYEQLFEAGKVEELSRIELENVVVD
ncbi:MAG: DUF6503 family protein [Cyclobacteriaceae bacterium]